MGGTCSLGESLPAVHGGENSGPATQERARPVEHQRAANSR